MKYSIYVLLLSFVAFSCSEDDIKELAEISRDFTATETIEVSIGEDDLLTYSPPSVTIDASLAGVNISNIEVLSVVGNISNVVGTGVTLEEATLNISGANVTLSLTSFSIENGVSKEFELTSGSLDAIADAVENDGELTFTVSATVDQKPVEFDIEVVFNLRATGSLL